jgi:hypothetical protein
MGGMTKKSKTSQPGAPKLFVAHRSPTLGSATTLQHRRWGRRLLFGSLILIIYTRL